MRLRKKLNTAGFLFFFAGAVSAVLSTTQRNDDLAGLLKLFASVFILMALILAVSAFVIKKLHRRKKRSRTHSRQDRTVMTPYTETEGYKRAEKDEEVTEYATEPTSEEKHNYQIYTMSPKRKTGKNKKASKRHTP